MGSLKLPYPSGNSTILHSPAANPSADITMKLPSTTGSAGQYLKVASANHSSTNAELEWGTVSQTEQDASTGDYTLTSGNLVIATSGKGIDFSATADGSGTDSSSLLDDYEEGTWTPVLKSGSDTITYDSGSYTRFTYTKIGNMVTVWMTLDNRTTSGTTGGAFTVEGLPYAPVDSTGRMTNFSALWWGSGLRLSHYPVATHTMPGDATLEFYYKTAVDANYAAATITNVGSNSYLFFTHTYEVNS